LWLASNSVREMGINQVLRQLSQTTNIFGLKLWAVIGIGAGVVVIFVTVFILCLWCTRSRQPSKLSSRDKLSSGNNARRRNASSSSAPAAANDDDAANNVRVVVERLHAPTALSDPLSVVTISKTGAGEKKNHRMMPGKGAAAGATALKRQQGMQQQGKKGNALKNGGPEGERKKGFSWMDVVALGFRRDDSMTQQVELHRPRLPSEQQQQQQIAAWHAAVVESDHSSLLPSQAAPRKESLSDESRSGSRSSCSKDSPTVAASAAAAGSDLGWGQWYTSQEIKLATNDFADNMLLGEGGYGVVYRGQLPNGTLVAVKNLRNNKSVMPSLSLQFFSCSKLFPNSPPDRHAESVIGMYGYTEIETHRQTKIQRDRDRDPLESVKQNGLFCGLEEKHTLKKLRKSWIH
jgi:hypothetical protein